MAKTIRRERHKMEAFVRFREIADDEGALYVAWFEPEHHVVELTAPFFARRFASMRWSILTAARQRALEHAGIAVRSVRVKKRCARRR